MSELGARCPLSPRPRRAADGPAAAQRLLSPALFVLSISAPRCGLRSPEHVPPFFGPSGNASAPLTPALRHEMSKNLNLVSPPEWEVPPARFTRQKTRQMAETRCRTCATVYKATEIRGRAEHLQPRAVYWTHKGWHKSHITVNKHLPLLILPINSCGLPLSHVHYYVFTVTVALLELR